MALAVRGSLHGSAGAAVRVGGFCVRIGQKSRRNGANRRRHIEHLIVEGEVVRRDHVDPGLLLQLPVSRAECRAGREQRWRVDRAFPVGFGCLFQLALGADAREAEVRSFGHG